MSGPILITPATRPINVTVPMGKQGPPGPPGQDGADGQDAKWEALTQVQFDALPVKDPATLYVIIP